MPRTKRGELKKRLDLEEDAKIAKQMAALDPQQQFYVPPPAPRRPKQTQSTTTNTNKDTNDADEYTKKSAEFEAMWDFFFNLKSSKTHIEKDQLKKMKRFGLILRDAEFQVAADWHQTNGSLISHFFEFDSTPYSSRIRQHLAAWSIDRSSSVLNFSSGLLVEIGQDKGRTAKAKKIQIPMIVPCHLLPKKQTDDVMESEKLFSCVARYLKTLIQQTAPKNGTGVPLAIVVGADWASANLLALLWILVYLDKEVSEYNYTVVIERCLAHVNNNNSLHASTRWLAQAAPGVSVRDVGNCLWKRCSLLVHHGMTLERQCSLLDSQSVVVRNSKSVGKVSGCKVRATREIMSFLGCGEDSKTEQKLHEAGCYRLGLLESKIVWVDEVNQAQVHQAGSSSCSSSSSFSSSSIIVIDPEGTAWDTGTGTELRLN